MMPSPNEWNGTRIPGISYEVGFYPGPLRTYYLDDKSGVIEPSVHEVNYNPSTRSWFKFGAQNGSGVVPTLATWSNQPEYVVVVPIMDTEASLAGISACGLRVQFVEQMLATEAASQADSNSIAFVMDSTGTLIFSSVLNTSYTGCSSGACLSVKAVLCKDVTIASTAAELQYRGVEEDTVGAFWNT